MDCIFCKIISGEIPSKKVYEDEQVLAFYDLDPKAPVHILVIPKQHIQSVAQLDNSNSQVLSHIFEVIAKIAKDFNLDDGFRVVTNTGESAGQTVPHLHFHLLGGRDFTWPPG
ncbi:MAG: histidine triad nucleotide-binding protein [Clostridia bacterium]|nr:histidine triad nucleotide-binding protein [Clostridia bacterium]